MTISRTYFCVKKLAPCSNLKNNKAKLAFSSCFRRWVSAESRQLDEIAKELSKGKCFAALGGNGDYGRLGFGNLQSEWRPKPLIASAFDDQSLREVACGGAHTLFLTAGGDLYAWGSNENGCLGIGCNLSPKESKVHFLSNLLLRYPVVGSTQPRFLEAIFTHGAGEVQMEHLKKMDILQADNWLA